MKIIRYSLLILLCTGLGLTAMAGGVREAHNNQDKYAPEAPVLQEILAESSEEASLIAEEMHVEAEHIAVKETAPETKPTRSIADMSKTEQKAARKQLRKDLKTMRKSAKKNARPDGQYAEEIICVIFAILLPPLGVYLHEGIGTNFWIDLILTLLTFWIGGVIFALVVILVM